MSVRYEFISLIDWSLTYRKIDNHTGKMVYWAYSSTWHDIRWEIWEPFLPCCQWFLTYRSKSSIPSNHLLNIEHNVDISYYQNSDYKCANTPSEWYPWLTALKQEMLFIMLFVLHYQNWWYVDWFLLPFFKDLCLCLCWKNIPLNPWCYYSSILLMM